MSVEEHPLSLNLEQHHAFAERVAWHIVTVVPRVWQFGRSLQGERLAEQPVGMGTACQWNGRKFILTAKHVIEEARPEQIEFCTRADGPVDWGVRSPNPLVVHPQKMQIESVFICKTEDLACIVLKPDQSFGLLEFLELPSRLGPLPPAGGTLIHGCPVDQNVPVNAIRQREGGLLVGLATRPRGCWAEIEADPPTSLPSSFDPDRHFLLKYDPNEEGAQPHGFSGCGVWGHRKTDEPVWSANPVLLGVEYKWHRPTNLMFSVRSEVIQGFLAEVLED